MILTIIILVVISLIISIGNALYEDDFIEGVKMLVVCFCVSFFIFLFVGVMSIFYYTDETINTNTYDIVSLQDKTETKAEYAGGFIYGRGYIKSELYYYIAVKYPQGVKIEKYDIDNCYLVLNNDENPKIERYNYIATKRQQERWFMDVDSGQLAYYRIYLPENAIQLDMDYKIDLQ